MNIEIKENDLFVEMLEVIINAILYIRNIYPSTIFKRHKMYNTIIYTSIYPPLNDYISNVLKSAVELKKNNKLHKLEIVFFTRRDSDRKDESIRQLESFVIEMVDLELLNSTASKKSSIDDDYNNNDDKYLFEFEEKIRSFLLSLEEKCKNLINLPAENVEFRIQMHTTQSEFVNLSNNSNLQSFPWLQVFDEKSITEEESLVINNSTILPLCANSILQIYAVDYL